MIEADRLLEDLTGRYARNYTTAIRDMLVAKARGNRPAYLDARQTLEGVIRETMGAAEVLGASLTLRLAAGLLPDEEPRRFAADRSSCLAFSGQTILPRVTFSEAVQDLIERTPVTLKDAAERTGLRIAELYSEGKVTAFAKSAEDAVTKRVQAIIRQAVIDGDEEIGVGRLIKASVDEIRDETEEWTEGYARMAFRTNVNTGVTAGRFRQANDPDIKKVTPCFRFDTVGDSDTRDNHQAFDGLIYKVDNPIWRQIAPPIGYNCRCQVSLMGLPLLRRFGRVNADGSIREDLRSFPPGAFVDPGFRPGGRPDLPMSL